MGQEVVFGVERQSQAVDASVLEGLPLILSTQLHPVEEFLAPQSLLVLGTRRERLLVFEEELQELVSGVVKALFGAQSEDYPCPPSDGDHCFFV